MASSPGGRIIPGLQPPPGVTPNFVNPYNQSKYTPTMVATLLPVATAVVWIRMYTKIRLIKSHGWEDCKSLAFQAEEFDVLMSPRHFVHCLGVLASFTHLSSEQVPKHLPHFS